MYPWVLLCLSSRVCSPEEAVIYSKRKRKKKKKGNQCRVLGHGQIDTIGICSLHQKSLALQSMLMVPFTMFVDRDIERKQPANSSRYNAKCAAKRRK